MPIYVVRRIRRGSKRTTRFEWVNLLFHNMFLLFKRVKDLDGISRFAL